MKTENILRVSKISTFGDRMVDVRHSEGFTRIALEWEHLEDDLSTINAAGYEHIESELKRKTGCDEIEFSN